MNAFEKSAWENSNNPNTIKNPQTAVETGLIINNIADTAIRLSSIHGFDLFATKPIAAGTKLATLDGQVVSFNFYQTKNRFCQLVKSLLITCSSNGIAWARIGCLPECLGLSTAISIIHVMPI